MIFSNGRIKRLFYPLILVFVFTFLFQGCQPLRKKFIRQKKRDDLGGNQTVVFEPQDYSPENYTPEEKYTKNYNLWVIWGKSLEETITDGSENEKRYKYFLEKGLEALNEMSSYLKEPKKTELDAMILEFNKINEEFARPYIFWNIVRIRNRINSNSIKIRTTFNPLDVKNFFIDP